MNVPSNTRSEEPTLLSGREEEEDCKAQCAVPHAPEEEEYCTPPDPSPRPTIDDNSPVGEEKAPRAPRHGSMKLGQDQFMSTADVTLFVGPIRVAYWLRSCSLQHDSF